MKNNIENYEGYEIGPIRPPSEARSLLLRVTRNCPWNQCKFCGLYKGKKFSIRPKDHIIKDIDLIKRCVNVIKEMDKQNTRRHNLLTYLKEKLGSNNDWAYHSAISWYRSGMKSIFLQDANSMIIKPQDMKDILNHIKNSFPNVERITSYARSHTIARISDKDLKSISVTGLNRIHIGMETGCNTVLNLVKKGVDKSTHIIAGQKVKKAGIELSEYFMPGLGGKEYSKQNALETADTLNKINPDYIRIRTLAIPKNTPLFEDYNSGVFTRTNDDDMVNELYLLIENLKGITSTIKSDHIVNLIPEVEGLLPEDKKKMLYYLDSYLNFSYEEKLLYRIGRRTGIMNNIQDLYDPLKRSRINNIVKENNILDDNVDNIVDELMRQYI